MLLNKTFEHHLMSLMMRQNGSNPTEGTCINERTESQRENNAGCKGGTLNSIRSTRSLTVISSLLNASSLLTPLAILLTCHQKSQQTLHSIAIPSLQMPVDVSSLCWFGLVLNYPTMQCPAILPHVPLLLINVLFKSLSTSPACLASCNRAIYDRFFPLKMEDQFLFNAIPRTSQYSNKLDPCVTNMPLIRC